VVLAKPERCHICTVAAKLPGWPQLPVGHKIYGTVQDIQDLWRQFDGKIFLPWIGPDAIKKNMMEQAAQEQAAQEQAVQEHAR
jgi:hypothetical protein